MLKMMGILIGILIVMAGVVCVYDARVITSRVFGFGDQNEATLGLKMVGFFFCMIGAFMVYFMLGK